MPTQGDAMRARRAFDAKNQRDDVDHLNPLIPSIPLMPHSHVILRYLKHFEAKFLTLSGSSCWKQME